MKKKGIRKMKFVIQRVTHAEVEVEQKIIPFRMDTWY